MNLDEQLSFILRFAQLDLRPNLRGSALQHLRGQLAAFFHQKAEDKPSTTQVLGFVAVPQDPPLPNAFTQDQFAEMHRDLSWIMRGQGGLVIPFLERS